MSKMSNVKNFFNKNKKEINCYVKLFLFASFLSVVLRYFIMPIEIFSPGIAGVAQGITYILTSSIDQFSSSVSTQLFWNTTFYWCFYSLFNLPIIIFSIKFYGKDFIGKSIFVFFVSFSVSLFLTYTPVLSESSLFSTDEILALENKTAQMTIYIVSALIGGILYGFAIGSIFKVGATSLGFDPVARYLSREKGKNITKILFLFSMVSAIFFTTILGVIDGDINSFETFINNLIFGKSLIAAIIFLLTYSFIVGKIYNANSKIVLKIITKNAQKISKLLNKIDYHRGHTLEEGIGGFKKSKMNIIMMVINREELDDLIELISKIDEHAFMYTSDVQVMSSDYVWNPIKFKDKNSKYNNLQDIREIINEIDDLQEEIKRQSLSDEQINN